MKNRAWTIGAMVCVFSYFASPAWGGSFNIAHSSQDEQHSIVAYNSIANEYLAVWKYESSTDDDIYAQRVARNGTLIGGKIRIATSSKNEYSPSVTYNAAVDEYLIVYVYDYSWYDQDIYAARVASDGTVIQRRMLVSNTVAPELSPVVTYNEATHGYLVCFLQYAHLWDCPDDTGCFWGIVYARTVTSDGKFGSKFIVAETENDKISLRTPALAFNSVDNQYLVAWRYGSKEVHAQLVNSSGSLIGGELTVVENTSSSWDPLGLAYNSINNQYLFVYKKDGEIYADRLSSNVTPLSSTLISVQGSAYERNPCVAFSPYRNKYLVCWESRPVGQNHYDIKCSHIYANGNLDHFGELEIAGSNKDEWRPSVAYGTDGYLVTYDYRYSNSDWDIRGSLVAGLPEPEPEPECIPGTDKHEQCWVGGRWGYRYCRCMNDGTWSKGPCILGEIP